MPRLGRTTFGDWLKASEYRGSPTAFARAQRIPRTTVQHWARGAGIGVRYRARLRSITGIDEFATRKENPTVRDPDADRAARRVRALVGELARELSRFTRADGRGRALLRERLDQETAHRVANLLLLLLDERRYAEYRELNRTLAERR